MSAQAEQKSTPSLPVLTYEQFRKLYKATRIYQAYDHDDRARHASSHRLGYHQRQAQGEFYYTHDLCPGLAFDTAQQATTRAYGAYLASVEGKAELLAACEWAAGDIASLPTAYRNAAVLRALTAAIAKAKGMQQ